MNISQVDCCELALERKLYNATFGNAEGRSERGDHLIVTLVKEKKLSKY